MPGNILKQSSKISLLGLISRCIAFFREVFLIRFLSVGAYSDIFFTAIRIPNTLRKILAEGALSSILVPAFIQAKHARGSAGFYKLVSLSFVLIEACMVACCALLFFFTIPILKFIVPGFSPEKIQACATLLRILISFVIFISSGSVFSAALQAEKKFFIPALAPSILNICYVASLIICLWLNLSITIFCYFWIITSLVFFGLHLFAYLIHGYWFATPDKKTYQEFHHIIFQFFPCFFIVGIGEINHFINTRFCSYLFDGSMTMLRYTYQFVNIPSGIITTPLVTVLLPYFTSLHIEKSEKLPQQLFEAIKFIVWIIMPITVILAVFSNQLFYTLFWGDNQAIANIYVAQSTFIAYLIGLVFFSLNKIFSCLLYAQRATSILLLTTIASLIVNYQLNAILTMKYQAAGIAFSSSIAAIVQTILFIFILRKKINIAQFWYPFLQFLIRSFMQLIIAFAAFYALHTIVKKIIISSMLLHPHLQSIISYQWILHGLGFWIWTGPLILLFAALLFFTCPLFNIHLAYLHEEK